MIVHKYTLPNPSPFGSVVHELEMPMDAWILQIQEQHGQIAFWVIVDPEKEKETRRFLIQGTGQELDCDIDDLVYADTVQIDGFAWHIFEISPMS